jgi:sugar-phosphatase
VVVEDAPPGIQAAHSAGMAVVAVATTHPASELSGADAVAQALSNVSLGENGTTADGRIRLELHVRGG